MDVVSDVISWLTDPAQWSGPDGIPVRTLQHLWYSLLATVIAAAIALPIGIWIGHTGRGALVAVNLTNLGRAIPSLGIIILMFTLVGFGIVPVLVALVALAVPPIVTNTYIGVRSVDRDVREAAEGMGMRGRQVLWRVGVPGGPAPCIGGGRPPPPPGGGARTRPSVPRWKRPHSPGTTCPRSQRKEDRPCEGSGLAAPPWRPALRCSW